MERLPEELMRQIVSLIGNHEGKIRNQQLLNVMLSSKRLYSIARPILYNTVELGHTFAIFMQALAYKPDTISLVKQLHIEPWHDLCDRHFRYEQSLVNVMLREAGIADMPRHYQRNLRHGLTEASKDVILCIVLAMCKDLLVLEIRCAFWSLKFFTAKFSPEVKLRKNLLNKLRMLRTQVPSPSDMYNVCHVLPFWQSPPLECYEGHRVECINIVPGPPPQPSNLRHIVLRDTLISSVGLEYILTSSPLLRTIDIELADLHASGLRTDWRSWGDVLSRHGTELERLVIDTGLFRHEASDTVLGNLTGMIKLRSVFLEWNSVFGPTDSATAVTNLSQEAFLTNNLPSCRLRELVLRTHGRTRTSQVQEDSQLVELMKSERLGSLQMIVLLDRSALLLSLPQGWKQSLGGKRLRLEWGTRVASCWQGRVIETEGVLILERV